MSPTHLLTNPVGIWIDHRQATLVFLKNKENQVDYILSDVQPQLHRVLAHPAPGGSEGLSDPSEESRERSIKSDLLHYYERVVKALVHVDAILLMGPGEAKGELQKRLEKDGFGAKIVEVQTTDKLTQPQIVSRVKQYYKENNLLQ